MNVSVNLLVVNLAVYVHFANQSVVYRLLEDGKYYEVHI